MLRRAAIIFAGLFFATVVLLTSIFRSTAPEYAFSQQPAKVLSSSTPEIEVPYYLPYPGILPDSFLWPVKAVRDKAWLLLTRDNMKRANLLLLFADKRVGMAAALAQGGKANLAVSTATKGEKYLEEAFFEQEKAAKSGVDTVSFLFKLANASLKHIQALEQAREFLPEDARPHFTKTLDYPKMIYEKTTHTLNAQGRTIPVLEATPSAKEITN